MKSLGSRKSIFLLVLGSITFSLILSAGLFFSLSQTFKSSERKLKCVCDPPTICENCTEVCTEVSFLEEYCPVAEPIETVIEVPVYYELEKGESVKKKYPVDVFWKNLDYILPLPKKFTPKKGNNNVYLYLNQEDFDFETIPEHIPDLQFIIEHYREIIFETSPDVENVLLCPNNAKCINNVIFKVADPSHTTPNVKMVESYSIKVEPFMNTTSRFTVVVSCAEIFGCYRGIERLAQLSHVNTKGQLYLDNFFPIEDSPRFVHRGLLVDTSRHYLSIPVLQNIIRSASYVSINVIHWHMMDDQSFPIVIKKRPALHKYGAYDPNFNYTTEDIAGLVEYARRFGVRMYPEIDVPTHINSWCLQSEYDICAKCKGRRTLDPTVEETYAVIEDVISEIAPLFPEPYFHFGGDEVVVKCWSSDKALVARMKKMGISSNNQLLAHFAKRLFALFEKYNLTAMCWEECVLDSAWRTFKIPKNVVVQTWRKEDNLKKVLQKDHPTILSRGFYLNNYENRDWQQYYTNEPFKKGTFTPQERGRLLGGEATAWGEHISGSNWENHMYPGLLLVSERLWSPDDRYWVEKGRPWDWEEGIRRRVEAMRCELIRRGFRASPLKPGFCPYE